MKLLKISRLTLFTYLFVALLFSCEDEKITNPQEAEAFVKFYGGIKTQEGNDVKQTPDGGYILVGSTTSFGNGGSDVYVVKVDAFGNEEWSNTYGGPNNDYGKSVQLTPDGGYVIVGDFQQANATSDIYMLKINETGSIVFEHTFSNNLSDSNEFGNEIKLTLDGGYIIVGTTSNPDGVKNGPFDFYLVKTDSNGNLQWQRTRGFENSAESGNSVIQIDDQNYIVIGTASNARENDGQMGKTIFAYKINANGDNIGNRFYGGVGDDIGNQICKTSLGFAIIGTSSSILGNAGGGQDIIVIQLDQNLNQFALNTYGGTNDDQGVAISQLSDGGFVMVGATNSFSNGSLNSDVLLLKTDITGEILPDWRLNPRTFGGEGIDVGNAVIKTEDGFAIVATSTFFEATNNTVLNLIKTNESGLLIK